MSAQASGPARPEDRAPSSSGGTSAQRWAPLGSIPPRDLVDDRLQLHWAVQPLARFAEALTAPRPGDAHTGLAWDPDTRRLVSEETPGLPSLHLALQVDRLELFLSTSRGVADRRGIRGATVDEVLEWIEIGVSKVRGGGSVALSRDRPALPRHPVGRGSRLNPRPEGLAELARWFHDAYLALGALARAEPRAGEIRCWPHHLDIATVITLSADGANGDEEGTGSVGVGMEPGDSSYAEPYFYLEPWPAPSPDVLPALAPPGEWHFEGWTGAVLRGSVLVQGSSDGATQARTVGDFLRGAMAACSRRSRV